MAFEHEQHGTMFVLKMRANPQAPCEGTPGLVPGIWTHPVTTGGRIHRKNRLR